MQEITILVPKPEPGHELNIDVNITGSPGILKFRVEMLERNSLEDAIVQRIKNRIESLISDWECINIQGDRGTDIVLTFRKKLT
ncbi:MAG: hypothetical protein Q7J34_00575 [Bacteroidales bacterium]|jgi:hypothetical protein|nr:hypothetical protein [Bacteroidales bacterium]